MLIALLVGGPHGSIKIPVKSLLLSHLRSGLMMVVRVTTSDVVPETWVHIKTPLISVVMSVYNGERYLDEAMSRILNQTFIDFCRIHYY